MSVHGVSEFAGQNLEKQNPRVDCGVKNGCENFSPPADV